jgi:hypothetical protein
MDKLTWGHRCYFCYHQIERGKPSMIFATDQPMLIGLAHSTCSATKYRYERFQMCPPNVLSNDQVSFLLHFFPMLYKLPAGDLRKCLAAFILEYPESTARPMGYLKKQGEDGIPGPQPYSGDLEVDFLHFLGWVQKAAGDNPANVEADFRKSVEGTV